MPQFTVVGSLNYDLVSYTKRIPAEGETFQSDSFATHIGGKGLNQAIAIAKLLPRSTTATSNNENINAVRFVGKVGDDGFGKELTQSLTKLNVDVTNVEVIPNQRSGVAVIIVEESGQNRILINPGANGDAVYTPEDLEKIFPADDDEVVVFQNEIPGTVETIKWLGNNRRAKTIVYNPSPYYSYSTSILKFVHILLVNEVEALAIAKDFLVAEDLQSITSSIEHDFIKGYSLLATELARSLTQTDGTIPRQFQIVITLGSHGSLFISSSDLHAHFIEAIKVPKVVDTTGAGDTFTGAFLSSLIAQKNEIEEAVKFSTVASSLAIQKSGASDSIPTYEELKKHIDHQTAQSATN